MSSAAVPLLQTAEVERHGSPRNSMVIARCRLSWWLQFADPEVERRYMLHKAFTARHFDKCFLLVRLMIFCGYFVQHFAIAQLHGAVISFLITWVGYGWLMFRHVDFWRQHRSLLLLVIKIQRAVFLPAAAPVNRLDVVSWATAIRLMLVRTDVAVGLIALYACSSTFRIDAVSHALYILKATSMAVHVARTDGGFCGAGSDDFMERLRSALQQGVEMLCLAPRGCSSSLPMDGHRCNDACLVIALFTQVFLGGVLPLVAMWYSEHRARLRWQRGGVPLSEYDCGSWQLDLAQSALVLIPVAALLFTYFNDLAWYLPPPHCLAAPAGLDQLAAAAVVSN